MWRNAELTCIISESLCKAYSPVAISYLSMNGLVYLAGLANDHISPHLLISLALKCGQYTELCTHIVLHCQ